MEEAEREREREKKRVRPPDEEGSLSRSVRGFSLVSKKKESSMFLFGGKTSKEK